MVNKLKHHPHHQHKPRPKGFTFIKRMADYDFRLTNFLAISANKQAPYYRLRPLWKLLEISGHGVPWLVSLTAGLVLVRDRPWVAEIIVNVIFALIMDLITVVLLKYSVKRPRPSHNKMDMFGTVPLDHYSFPSGHATRAAMLAYFAHEQLLSASDKNYTVWTWSAVVAASRVFLGRHYVSDAAIGYVIGLIEYLWFVQVGWIEQEKCVVINQFMNRLQFW